MMRGYKLKFLLKVKAKLIRILLWLLFSPFIPINSYLIRKYGNKEIAHQPIFIIGAPRTGSTVLYQALTNQSRVLYFDNLVCHLNHIVFIGFWLSQKSFGNNTHNSFRSNFGNTSRSGLHAPSECGSFWYRWLPKHKHFIDYEDIDNIDFNQIKREITAVTNYWNQPIIFKNLNAGQRMRLIKKIFPEAKFVFITRQPFFIAQSILEAKRRLNIDDHAFWSIMPKNIEYLRKLDWPNQIAGQIYSLEQQILLDAALFKKKSFIRIEYSELSEAKVLELIQTLNLELRINVMKLSLEITEKNRLFPEETQLLIEAINALNWKNDDK